MDGLEDWVNELFLSCRFQAERDGPYNEYVYNFFKCLTPERLEYAEGYYEEQSPVAELWECEGYLIQRRCPHLKADLTRFAQVEDGVLTCTMHGWQFELATGRCLTSDDRKLFSQRITSEGTAENGLDGLEDLAGVDMQQGPGENGMPGPSTVKCKHCWYVPPREQKA